MSADYGRTIELGQEGDELSARSDYDAALAKYQEAWNSVPGDKGSFPLLSWLVTALADAYEEKGLYSNSLDFLLDSLEYEKCKKDSLINIIIGKHYIDYFDDVEAARPYLEQAWELSEGRAFRGEDPKYVKIIRAK